MSSEVSLAALQALARAVLAQLYGRQDARILLTVRYEHAAPGEGLSLTLPAEAPEPAAEKFPEMLPDVCPTVPGNGRLPDLDRDILALLSSRHNLKADTISRQLGRKDSTVRNHLAALGRLGLVLHEDHGYGLTAAGRLALSS